MKTQPIAIIAITAFSEQFNREAAMAARGDGGMAKPISARTLAQQIAEAIEKVK
jgi:CheY-like chemotaxis protein